MRRPAPVKAMEKACGMETVCAGRRIRAGLSAPGRRDREGLPHAALFLRKGGDGFPQALPARTGRPPRTARAHSRCSSGTAAATSPTNSTMGVES